MSVQNMITTLGVYDVVRRLNFLVSERRFSEIAGVFTEDAEFINPNGVNAQGIDDLYHQMSSFKSSGVAHHTTTMHVLSCSSTEAVIAERALTIAADGSGRAALIVDYVRLTPQGWRIYKRTFPDHS